MPDHIIRMAPERNMFPYLEAAGSPIEITRRSREERYGNKYHGDFIPLELSRQCHVCWRKCKGKWKVVLFLFVLIPWKKKNGFVSITLKDSQNSRESINCFEHSKIVLLVQFIFAKIKRPCQTDWRPSLRTLKHLWCSTVILHLKK